MPIVTTETKTTPAVRLPGVTLQKVMEVRGRRRAVVGWLATLGDFEGRGATPAAAAQALAAEIARYPAHRRRYVRCGDGTVLAVYPVPGGAGYDMVGGAERPSCPSVLGFASLEEALAAAQRHAAQAYGGVVAVVA